MNKVGFSNQNVSFQGGINAKKLATGAMASMAVITSPLTLGAKTLANDSCLLAGRSCGTAQITQALSEASCKQKVATIPGAQFVSFNADTLVCKYMICKETAQKLQKKAAEFFANIPFNKK